MNSNRDHCEFAIAEFGAIMAYLRYKCPMIEFKPADETDLAALLKLMRLYYDYDGHRFEATKAEAGLRQLIRGQSFGEIWLMRVREPSTNDSARAPLGYLVISFGFSLECGGREAFIDELFVLEEHRGRGIGKLALEHAALRCEQAGVRALRLEVTRENTRVLGLYQRLGFKDLGRYLLTRWLGSGA